MTDPSHTPIEVTSQIISFPDSGDKFEEWRLRMKNAPTHTAAIIEGLVIVAEFRALIADARLEIVDLPQLENLHLSG